MIDAKNHYRNPFRVRKLLISSIFKVCPLQNDPASIIFPVCICSAAGCKHEIEWVAAILRGYVSKAWVSSRTFAWCCFCSQSRKNDRSIIWQRTVWKGLSPFFDHSPPRGYPGRFGSRSSRIQWTSGGAEVEVYVWNSQTEPKIWYKGTLPTSLSLNEYSHS